MANELAILNGLLQSNLDVAGYALQHVGGASHFNAAATLAFHNQADEATNYERARVEWESNAFKVVTENGGSGTARNLVVGAGTLTLATFVPGTIAAGAGIALASTLGGSSGQPYGVNVAATVNGSGTSGYTALRIGVTETATGSGTKRLIDGVVGGSTVFSVSSIGNVYTAGMVGIGAAPTFPLWVQSEYSGSASWRAGYFQVTTTHATTDATASTGGIAAQLILGHNSGVSLSSANGQRGALFYLTLTGTGTTTLAQVVRAYANSAAAGVITELRMFDASTVWSVASTVTTLYQFYANTPNGSGTVTNKWGWYQVDTDAPNYFSSRVGIGTVPSYPLHVLHSTTANVSVVASFSKLTTAHTSTAASCVAYSLLTSLNLAHASGVTLSSAGGQTAFRAGVVCEGTGTTTLARCLQAYAAFTAAGTITELRMLGTTLEWGVAGTIGTLYQVYLSTPTSVGTITNKYGINQVDTDAPSYLGSRIGIGITHSTSSWCVLAAPTTSLSSLRFTAGAAPSSPVDGDLWNDSTQKCLIGFFAGVKQADCRTLWTAAGAVDSTNTASEVSLLASTGVGTKTLPANFWTVGKTLRLRICAQMKSDTGYNVTFRLKLGSTAILTLSSVTPGQHSYRPCLIEAHITCHATGASGTLGASLHVATSQIAASYGTVSGAGDSNYEISLDTTASAAVDLTAQWSGADVDNGFLAHIATLEVLN